MPTNQYGQTEWDADPETAAELRRLANQEKMAAEMMKRGQVPLTGGMVGQTYVGASPLQGIANMLHQYNASKAAQNAEEGYKALGGRKAQEYADAISAYKKNTIGTPGTPEQALFTDDYTAVPKEDQVKAAVPAMVPTPDQRRQAIIEAAVSTNPRLSKMGQMDFQLDARKEDKTAAREDKLFQLELMHKQELERIKERAIEQRISKEEAQAQMIAAGERNARLIASLRPARDEGAPVAVTGPDGKPIYVSKKDAIGKTPAAMDIKADIQKQKELDKAAGVDKQLDAIERNIDKIMTPEGSAKPALKSYTGQLDQYYPEWAMSSDTAAAGSALKSLQEQMTMMNLAGAKAAVGQSFGSMQVKEWDKFMNLLTNVSRGVPDAEMESNVKFIRDFVKDKRDVLRAAIYGGTHGIGGPNPGPGGQSAGGKIGGNPHAGKTDAQIRAELGL